MIRSFLLYLLLVGLPVLGVSVVLRAGRDLPTSASFGGSWRVLAWPDSVCSPSGLDTLNLVIEQSGPALTIRTRRGVWFEGTVEGDSFRAAGRNRRQILGRRVPGSGGSRFDGIVSGAPCENATATRISATRLALPGGLTGH